MTTLTRKWIIDLKGHGKQQTRLRVHFVGGGKSRLFVPENFNMGHSALDERIWELGKMLEQNTKNT